MIRFLVPTPRLAITPGQSEAQLRVARLSSPKSAPDRSSYKSLALILLFATVLRLPGLFTDFWLDEIWSHDIAMQLTSTRDVLFSDAARIDNNHPLNSLFLRAVGPGKPFWIYRLPALISGIGCVYLAARIMRRAGPAQSLAAALLMAASFPFVFYSSEARGYAPAVFFAMLAFEALLSDIDRPRILSRLLFAASCVLGLLSHLTFVQFYMAALIWSVVATRSERVSRLLTLHVIPILAGFSLHQVFVRHLVIGGAPPRSAIDVLISAFAMLIGGPERRSDSRILSSSISILFATLTVAAFVIAIISIRRDRDSIFYVLAVVVAPGFLFAYDSILSERPQPLMVRYFLVAMAFALLAISHLASVRRGMIVMWIVLIVANVWQVASFLRDGRGGYSRAIQRMTSASGESTVKVAGDSAFRVGSVVKFYRQYLPSGRMVEFTDERASADWYIATRDGDVPAGFTLDATYPAPGLSGTRWQLYRRGLGR